MKAKVNDKCIGCGSCVSVTDSKVFDFNDEGTASCILDVIPSELEEVTNEAKDYCPVGAIEVVDGE